MWFYKVKQVLRDFREVEGYVHVLMYMTTWGLVHVRYRSVEARCPHPVSFSVTQHLTFCYRVALNLELKGFSRLANL